MSYEELQFEDYLACYCAPVLKKKKVANMFHLPKEQFPLFQQVVDLYNAKLNRKGLFFEVFQKEDNRITIYLYQREELDALLHRLNIREFLSTYHYPCGNIEAILHYLGQRLETCQTYPHEIGIFLGYPLCDVLGFIHHLPCQACGYWKVYQDPSTCSQLFKLYDQCHREIRKGRSGGLCIEQLVE